MNTSSSNTAPRQKPTEVRASLPSELIAMIDAWRAAQEEKPSRATAVRLLLTHHFWPPI
jgi:hypothetical protein